MKRRWRLLTTQTAEMRRMTANNIDNNSNDSNGNNDGDNDSNNEKHTEKKHRQTTTHT